MTQRPDNYDAKTMSERLMEAYKAWVAAGRPKRKRKR